MKTIGLIGGLTWLSTVEYYKLLNQLTNERVGGVSSAKIFMYSVNFEEIKTLTQKDDWNAIAEIISNAAMALEKAGADCLLLGANTMHNIAGRVQDSIRIPLLHIARQTATVIQSMGMSKVALLGTKYTMQLPFYREILAEYGIEVMLPGEDDIEFINNAIYEEMSRGLFLPETRQRFKNIISSLKHANAEAIILGCTEIPILLRDENCGLPLLDTTEIHAKSAVDFALS